jgi:hypothetical protein
LQVGSKARWGNGADGAPGRMFMASHKRHPRMPGAMVLAKKYHFSLDNETVFL